LIDTQISKSAFQFCNILGLAVALPLLGVTAMSFDHPSDPPHWTHLVFVFGNLAFPTLALAGIISEKQKYLGAIGLVTAVIGWALLTVICNGEFRCNA
jgi:branched-subunit amino acid permease